MDSRTVLACFLIENIREEKAIQLSRVKDWMFDNKHQRNIFKVLQEIEDKKDFETIYKRSGVNLATIVDLHMCSESVKWNDIPVTDEALKEWVDSKYLAVINVAIGKGDVEKMKSMLTEMETYREQKSPWEEYVEYKKDLVPNDSGLLGMSTGIHILDYHTLGLIKGHIWVCGAYRGGGKTFFMINLANAVLEQGKRVLIMSKEMSNAEIIQRLVGLRSGVGMRKFFNKEEADKLVDAEDFVLQKLESKDLVLMDSGSVNDLVIKIDSSKHFDFVCIDYVQLLASGMDQYEGLREVTNTLQELTKKHKFTLLLLSQISNSAQKDNRRDMDGYKGAGEIAQIANVGLRIYREADKDGNFGEDLSLNITKLRHGIPTTLSMKLKFPEGRFVSVYQQEFKPVEKDDILTL